ncbi:hypothetical protein V5P93_006232 [Actinokineospora auranticolor]|uniref:Uncharacterized protein n=1 Tax=Actinokineospora auranticolor TaxID=155976 RepID=A0A2S6GHY2_9PSEU|nr:hypothetical protein [Actinokineospora auranticolor]PPK64829.1 hypothetical protein CLV40_11768 [Actinokineospora auranticolor]
MPKKYAAAEKAALIALFLADTDVPNPELTARYGVRLDKPGRDRLNTDGLITSQVDRRPFVHRITQGGIDWCEKELAAVEPTPASGGLGRVGFELLRVLVRYLRAQGSIYDVVHPGAARSLPEDLESLILHVWQDLAVKPRDWVRLARIRPQLNGADRSEVDETLLDMVRAGIAHLAPDSNRKVLTEADHTAAIRVGGEDNHLLAIEES